MSDVDPNALAIEYLLALRIDRTGGSDADEHALRLARLSPEDLRRGLADDRARIAFWLDVYNAVVVRAGPIDLTDRRLRWLHFRRSSVEVAGRSLSLDAIEHGLLRGSAWKFGLGYVRNPVPGAFERDHRVQRPDPRIHFALNCGAASCPPIAAYDPERLDLQLDLATRSFLASEAAVEGDALRVSPLLLWYIGDFGGPAGIRRLLRHAGIKGWGRPLRFRTYDWSPAPDRWMGDSGEIG